MLCQLFFMIGVMYIGLGLEAYQNNWATSDSDQVRIYIYTYIYIFCLLVQFMYYFTLN
jgi:hypothetical protein